MKKTDIAVVGFMYAVCALFLSMTLKLPKAAQIYPTFIIVLLGLLTTAYLVKMIVSAKKAGVTSGSEDFEGFQAKQFFVILACIICYLVLMYFIGFYISTVLFMLACLFFLKVKPLYSVISVVAVVALVYCAFRLFLQVRLPVGLLFK